MYVINPAINTFVLEMPMRLILAENQTLDNASAVLLVQETNKEIELNTLTDPDKKITVTGQGNSFNLVEITFTDLAKYLKEGAFLTLTIWETADKLLPAIGEYVLFVTSQIDLENYKMYDNYITPPDGDNEYITT